MLPIKHSSDYKKRWPIAENFGLFTSPKTDPPTPLQIKDWDRLKELSFVFFLGWLFTGSRHAVCMMEFTIGHHAEVAKQEVTGGAEQPKQSSVSGKDVPKNKLMNFRALESYGFRCTHAHYFTITGEAKLGAATLRALTTTRGFRYFCLSDDCGENIEQLVLRHHDTPVPAAKLRAWHERLVALVEEAGDTFRKSL